MYCPIYRTRRHWSDRTVATELPLFPGYLFCRVDIHMRMPILTTPGVVNILGCGSEPASIPEQEIDAVKALLLVSKGAEPHPYLREGQRIRVIRGPLKGQEGILLKKKTEWKLVVSVTMLQRSVSAEIDRHAIAFL